MKASCSLDYLKERNPMEITDTQQLGSYETLYISPHLDDVAFSCSGSLISYNLKPLSVTIFSDSESTKHQQQFEQRKGEEKVAAERGKYDFLLAGFHDIRSTKHISHNGLIWGNIEPHLLDGVTNWLDTVIAKVQPKTVFAPLGVGRHVDHRIVHEACRVLEGKYPDIDMWYYEDRPYAFIPQAVEVRLNELGYCIDVDFDEYLNNLFEVSYMSRAREKSKRLQKYQEHIATIQMQSNTREITDTRYHVCQDLQKIWHIVSSYTSQLKMFIGSEEEFFALCKTVAMRYQQTENYVERLWRLN